MKDKHEYRFTIDAYSPDTLPMVRLAEYMGRTGTASGKDRIKCTSYALRREAPCSSRQSSPKLIPR